MSPGERSPPIVLVHGGLYEAMDATRFWAATGVIDALRDRGCEVLAPDRLPTPRSWADDADAMAARIAAAVDGPVVVVGGSNGCSTAVRLAVDRPALVAGLALCWPVTVSVDAPATGALRTRIAEVASGPVADGLLAGETLRGALDAELASLPPGVGLMAAEPENPVHQHRTVDRLHALLADPRPLTAMPEPPAAGFDASRFAATVGTWAASLPPVPRGDGAG